MNRPTRYAATTLLVLAVAASTGLAQTSNIQGTPLDGVIEWNNFDRAGWRAINKGWYDVAAREFESAIRISRRPDVNDPRLVARSYADFAWALQKQGRHAEAEPLVKWALTSREKLLGADSVPVAQNLNQLATLYTDLKRYAEADALLRRAIETQEASGKANVLELARTHTLLALSMIEQGKLAEAEPQFARVVKIREKNQGSYHVDTGDSLNNLGWIQLNLGKDDEARLSFERSLDIFDRSRTPVGLAPARPLEGLARLRVKAQEWAEAESLFTRAAGIRELLGGPGDPAALETLTMLADVLERLGKSDEAKKIRARINQQVSGTALKLGSDRFRKPDPVGSEPTRMLAGALGNPAANPAPGGPRSRGGIGN